MTSVAHYQKTHRSQRSFPWVLYADLIVSNPHDDRPSAFFIIAVGVRHMHIKRLSVRGGRARAMPIHPPLPEMAWPPIAANAMKK